MVDLTGPTCERQTWKTVESPPTAPVIARQALGVGAKASQTVRGGTTRAT